MTDVFKILFRSFGMAGCLVVRGFNGRLRLFVTQVENLSFPWEYSSACLFLSLELYMTTRIFLSVFRSFALSVRLSA